MSLTEGQPVPAFAMPTDGGGTFTSDDLRGRTTVLYFYPKDGTSGCTKEAQAFRDAMAAFTAAGVAVVGVSKDSVASHDKFKAKHDLPFTLASDDTGAVCEAFGVWVEKSMYGRKYMGIERATFLVDREAIVRRVWRKVKVTGHADAVLQAARSL